jgi:hypothetical protein
MNGCSGDCHNNTPPRCPCHERCETITKIMQTQRRKLNDHARYVRPRETRKGTVNFAECIMAVFLPGEPLHMEANNHASTMCIVIDSATGAKAYCEFNGLSTSDIRGLLNSYFSGPAFEVFRGVWVA